jgi:hypothetical protein
VGAGVGLQVGPGVAIDGETEGEEDSDSVGSGVEGDGASVGPGVGLSVGPGVAIDGEPDGDLDGDSVG